MSEKDLIAKLKFKTYQDFPIYSILSYTTTHTTDENINTFMATDGKTILINAKLIEKENLSFNDVLFIYLHEIKHIMFLHNQIAISLNLNQIVYNIATDVLINELTLSEIEPSNKLKAMMVRKELFSELKDVDVKKLTSLEIYNILIKRYKDKINIFNNLIKLADEIYNNVSGETQDVQPNSNETDEKREKGSNNEIEKIKNAINEIEKNKEIENAINEITKNEKEKNAIRDAIKDYVFRKHLEKLDKEEKEKLIKEINEKILNGYIIAKQRGVGAGDLENLIGHLFKKVRDWRKILRDEILAEFKDDWTYAKVSDLLQTLHIAGYTQIGNLPSRDYTYSINSLVIAVDTSGSISDNEYKDFLNEIYSIFKSVNVSSTEIILFDYEIQKVIKLNGSVSNVLEEIKKRKGYGGTRVSAVFDYLKNKNTYNSILIILTDGEHERLDVKDLKKFRKVLFVLSSEGTEKNIPNSRNIKIIKILGNR